VTYLGDYAVGATVRFWFDTSDLGGSPVTISSLAAHVLKNASATNLTAGVTVDDDFDGTGVHLVSIDLSASGNYAAGGEYALVVTGTVNGVTIRRVMATFSIAARTLADVTAIKTVTDNLPSFVHTAGKLWVLDGNGNPVAPASATTAIKAKTDNLPGDPADASDIATAFSAVTTSLGTIAGYIDTEVSAIKAKTDNLPAIPAAIGDIPTAAQNATAVRTELGTELARVDAAVSSRSTYDRSATLADSVPADGSRPSADQALYAIYQFLTERAVSGTTLTVKKPDGTTTLMTFTLSDPDNPTSITRAA
jgi:flagellin-like hook-associated protein FlgL